MLRQTPLDSVSKRRSIAPLNNFSDLSFSCCGQKCPCGVQKHILKERKENYLLKQSMKKEQKGGELSDFPFSEKRKQLYLLRKQNQQLQNAYKRSRISEGNMSGFPSLLSQSNHYIQKLEANQRTLLSENERLTNILMMRLKVAQQ